MGADRPKLAGVVLALRKGKAGAMKIECLARTVCENCKDRTAVVHLQITRVEFNLCKVCVAEMEGQLNEVKQML